MRRYKPAPWWKNNVFSNNLKIGFETNLVNINSEINKVNLTQISD
jgi:hypothetical protein